MRLKIFSVLLLTWSTLVVTSQGQAYYTPQPYNNYGGPNPNYQPMSVNPQQQPVSQALPYIVPPPPRQLPVYNQPQIQQQSPYYPPPPQQQQPISYAQPQEIPYSPQQQQQYVPQQPQQNYAPPPPPYAPQQQPYYGQQQQQQQPPYVQQQPIQQPPYGQQQMQQPAYGPPQERPNYPVQGSNPPYNTPNPQQQPPLPPSMPGQDVNQSTPPPNTTQITIDPASSTTTISAGASAGASVNAGVNTGVNTGDGIHNVGLDANINGNVSAGVEGSTNINNNTANPNDVIGFPIPGESPVSNQTTNSSTPATTTPASVAINDTATSVLETRSLPNNDSPPTINDTAAVIPGIPKSKLFNLNFELTDISSLAPLHGNKFTRFQIWFITSKMLNTLDEGQKPDYVVMLPPPFQKGIPSVNISQVIGSPAVRHDVIRALVEESPGMLQSQLASIRLRLRLTEPFVVKSILSSADPSQLLSLFSPRTLKTSIPTFIQVLADMPEMGRFGAKTIRAKLLPKNFLITWLNFARGSDQIKWTAGDLLGQTQIGANSELQYTILGLTCQDILSLPPADIVPIIQVMREDIDKIRQYENVDFPMELRRCMLEKVLEYLKTKGVNKASHILDNFSPADIKAIGGEVLTAIPTSALKRMNGQTRQLIIEEIGRLDTVWLITFASLKKLNFYATEIFMGPSNTVETKRSITPQDSPSPSNSTTNSTAPQPRAANDDDTLISFPVPGDNSTLNNNNDTTTGGGTLDASINSTANLNGNAAINGLGGGGSIDGNIGANISGSIVANSNNNNPGGATITIPAPPTKDQNPVQPVGGTYTTYRRRRATNSTPEENANKLKIAGNLYCYSTTMMDLDWDKSEMKNFLEGKDDPGEKTCCMDKISRHQWNRLLKSVYGDNVTGWSEFDLVAMGDLLISLKQDELNSISLATFSKVLTRLITRSGLNKLIKTSTTIERISFADACAASLDGSAEQTEFLASYKRYMKRLAEAAEWVGNNKQARAATPKVTCNGLKLAGPAALGYTVDDFTTMDLQELSDCIDFIGTLNWDSATKVQLLQLFKDKFRFSSQAYNTLRLIELGNLVSELSDVQDIPLHLPDELDSIAVIGSQVKNVTVLKALASKLSTDNNLSFGQIGLIRSNNLRISINSFGNIICGMKNMFVNNLFDSDPMLFLDTSPALGKLEGCSFDVLATLANFAIRTTSYGPPELWNIADVRTIGVVVAGLSPNLVSVIPASSMEGLSALAVKSFPTQSIAQLTPDQISRLSPEAALAIDQNAVSNFSPSQLKAYKGAVAISNDDFVPMGLKVNQDGSPIGADPFELDGTSITQNDPLDVGDGKNDGFGGRSVGEEPNMNQTTTTTTTNNNNDTMAQSPEEPTGDNSTTTTTTTAPNPPVIPTGHADDIEIDDSDNTTVLDDEEKDTRSTPEKGDNSIKKSSSSNTLIFSTIVLLICLSSHLSSINFV